MGRLRLAAIARDYKEIDRQIREQFIHGLNGNYMLMEIIRELTKTEEGSDVTSEQVLVWVKKGKCRKLNLQ